MATAQQVTYDRPPEGLSRGRYTVPPWVIITLAAVILVAGVVFLVLRARAPKAAVDIDGAPGKPPGVPPKSSSFDGAASGPKPRAPSEP
jgi:hypothetical protein